MFRLPQNSATSPNEASFQVPLDNDETASGPACADTGVRIS